MDKSRMDPRKQFSKWLARWTAVYWFIFLTWLSAIMLIQPQSAIYAVYMAIIATVVMVLNVVSYTKNSTTEKLALAMLDKTKIQLSLSKPEPTEEEDPPEEEGGGNG